MGFAAPVFAVQGDSAAARQIGWVLGVKEVAAELFAHLRQPGMIWQSAEALLVRRAGATIEYLLPLLDGGKPLSRALAIDTPGLAASFAVSNIGGFGIHRDYRNKEVLVISRRLEHVLWTLVYKIDRAESLGVADQRITTQIIQFVLMILIITAAFIAVWRHGASLRSPGTVSPPGDRQPAQRHVHRRSGQSIPFRQSRGREFSADRRRGHDREIHGQPAGSGRVAAL